MNSFQKDGKRTAHDSNQTSSWFSHGGGSVMVRACMAANGTGSVVFTDDVPDDISGKRNFEVYWVIF